MKITSTEIAVTTPGQDEIVQRDPCIPSPCGQYAECRNVGGVPSCSCLASYIGIPPNCRPECTINQECQSNLACMREKCRDPCPGSCGVLAQCHVMNHVPICTCPQGYTGDPFSNCFPQPPRKIDQNFFPYSVRFVQSIMEYNYRN